MSARTFGCDDVHYNFGGIVHPHFVLDDFRLQSGGTKLSGDIIGGLLVFRRTRHVRLGRQSFQVLLGARGIGNREKLLFNLALGSGVAVSGHYGGLLRPKRTQQEENERSEQESHSILHCGRRGQKTEKLTLERGMRVSSCGSR